MVWLALAHVVPFVVDLIVAATLRPDRVWGYFLAPSSELDGQMTNGAASSRWVGTEG
jgi:hypothetical protein